MKINVYLPDKLGKEAKDNRLNLSMILRYEVQKRLLELELLKLKKSLELLELKKSRGNVIHKIGVAA